MTLYIEKPAGTFTIWKAKNTGYPPNIGVLWDDVDLNAIGLYNPAPATPVSPTHRVVSTTVERVGQAVKYVNATEVKPPVPPRHVPDRDAAIRALIAGDTVAAQAAMDKME